MPKGREDRMMTVHHQITIDGITYDIIRCRTPVLMEQAGYTNAAREMRTNGIAYVYDLKRPCGRKYYNAVGYTSGVFSRVWPIA